MSKRKDGHARGKYTLEFKLEAVRLVKGGQAVPVTSKILGVPVQTLGNWVRLSGKGQLATCYSSERPNIRLTICCDIVLSFKQPPPKPSIPTNPNHQ